MQLFSWLHKRLTGRSQTRATPARKPTPRFRPQLEALEDRDVPSTLTVTNHLGFGPGSLRAEIAAAQSGDTIVFAKGIGSTIDTAINSNGYYMQLEINKNLEIEGPGANKLAIGGGSRVFQVDAGVHVTLSGLTIARGNGTVSSSFDNPGPGPGGGILNFGTLMVSNCTLTHNHDSRSGITSLNLGGSIYNAGALTLSHTNVIGNDAYAGGGIYNAGTLTLSGSTVTNNYGGGIFNDTTGILTVLNSTVTRNTGFDLYNLGTWSADSSSTIGTVGP
jgi:hypothetical protein